NEEWQHRNAGQERHHHHHGAGHAERLGIAGELGDQSLVCGARHAGLGDEQARRSRHDQRRYLCDQPVADGEQGIGLRGVGKRHALLREADDHAADDVDEPHQQPGDGVAAHEFEAPSMAPKKLDSSSSVFLRRRASASSIRPAERSASIAICLPGMASRWKRAATSAMRPEPLVITTKFTITRIVNTMMPMTKLPPITNLPNASITCQAAAVPSWPCARMRRVEARLSESRSMVAMSSTVGKAENSSGAWMNNPVIRISTERMIETASAMSSSVAGSGRMSTTRI